jgi:putative ABC transport system substrate-binding protein
MKQITEENVDVIVTYGTPAGLAAKQATQSIPIVDGAMGDPLRTGLVKSLSHPEANLTGVSLGWAQGIPGKCLELLVEVTPKLVAVSFLVKLSNPNDREYAKEIEKSAEKLGLRVRIIDVESRADLDRAFARAKAESQAIVVSADPVMTNSIDHIIRSAAANKLPAIYTLADFAYQGGLIAYGQSLKAVSRKAAEYVDRILRGSKPSELPVEQFSEYALVVNLQTAKALGITVPESILLRADEVIR